MLKSITRRTVSLLLVFSMLLSLFPITVLAVDEREVVETIAGSLVTSKVDDTPFSLEDAFVYGADAGQYNHPYIKTVTGYPAYFYNSHWEKETSPGNWEEVSSYGFNVKTFTSGNYRYVSKVYIDNDSDNGPSATGGDDYKFNEDVTITVDDEAWTKSNYSTSADSTSITIYKDGFVMPVPDELQFPMANNCSIPENWVGVAINELDVSNYTEGGTSPYTYSFVSGPTWISVSEDGVISGTPTIAADSNSDLVVMVTDSAEATKQISIPVGTTHGDPNDRIVVSNIVATSEDIDEIATVGHEIVKPTIVVSSDSGDVDIGYPAYFYNYNSEWQVFNGESWDAVSSGTFEAGNSYRYAATVYIDNDGSNGPLETAGNEYRLSEDPLPTITLNDEAMTVSAEGGYFNPNASKVMAYSKTYVMEGDSGEVSGSIIVPTIDDLEIGYEEQAYSIVTVSLTNSGSVDSTYMQASLSGEDAESFQIDTNFGGNCVAPGTWTNLVYVRPVEGLAIGTYTATLTLKFDSDEDGVYETTIGSDDVSVTVTKKQVTNIAVTIDQEPEDGEYYEYEDFSHISTPASTTSWGGAGTGGCRYNVKVDEDWTVLGYGEGNEFVNGKEYQAFVAVSVLNDDEYEFADDVTATINGHAATVWNGDSYVELTYDYGVLGEEPVSGTAFEANLLEVDFGTLPAGFSATEAHDAAAVIRFTNTGTTTIILSNTNPYSSGPFGIISYDVESEIAPGEYLDVTLEPAQGSGYASVLGDYEGTYVFTATNAEDAEDTAVLNIDATVSIAKREITSIELTGSYTDPVVGEAIPELTNTIASVNGDAGYADLLDLDYIKWMKRTGEGMFDYDDATGTFEEGEKYTIQMFFTIKEAKQPKNKFPATPVAVTLEGAELQSWQLNETTLGMWLTADVNPEAAPAKTQLTIPTLDEDEFTYTKEEIEVTINDLSGDNCTVSGDTSATAVGNYSVTISINDKENYEWSNGSTDDIVLNWSIALPEFAGSITVPTFENAEVGYDPITGEGVSINITNTYIISPSRLEYEITGTNASDFSASLNKTAGLLEGDGSWSIIFYVGPNDNLSVGTYTATLTLKYDADNDSTYETIIGSGDLSFTVTEPAVVEKTKLTIPTLDEDEYTYTKEEIEVTINDLSGDNCTVSGDTSATAVGNYSVTISINDKENYEWSNGSTDDVVLNWSIVLPEFAGSITVPTFENAEVGYASIANEDVLITISNTYIISPSRLEYEITGTNASDFTVNLNKTAGLLNGDGSWNNMFYVKPNDNLSVGTYTATLTLKYDADNDSTYEITVGSGELSFTVTEPVGPTTYTTTVNGGTADPSTAVTEGTTVTITANSAPAGKEFYKWKVNNGGVTLEDEFSATTTFVMGTQGVEVTALWSETVKGPITYELTDSYGDGWNGASIIVTDITSGDEFVEELTIGSGNNSNNGSVELILGHTYSFKWRSGSWDSECNFILKDGNNDTIYSSSDLGLPANNSIFRIYKIGEVVPTSYTAEIHITGDGCKVSYDETEYSNGDTISIPGGTEVTLTAVPAEGMVLKTFEGAYGDYLLSDWTRTGSEITFTMPSNYTDLYFTFVTMPTGTIDNVTEELEVGYIGYIFYNPNVNITNAALFDPQSASCSSTNNSGAFSFGLYNGHSSQTGPCTMENLISIQVLSGLSAGTYTDTFTLTYCGEEFGTCTVTLTVKDPAPVTHDVTFDSNGGSEVGKQTINNGEYATKPGDPTNGDLYFAGWFVNPTIDNIINISGENVSYNTFDFANTAITENVELTALWVATATVNASGDGQINFALSGQELEFDDEYPFDSGYINAVLGITNEVIIGAKADEYNTFVKWTKDGEDYSTNATITETITANSEYVAVFEPIECTVSFNSNSGDGEMENVTVNAGTEYTLPACTFTAPEGKVFDKWNLGKQGDEITVTEDVELVAQWKNKTTSSSSGGSSRVTYKITTKIENGSISPENPTVNKNASKVFKINLDTGYVITDILLDGESVGKDSIYTISNVTSDHTLEVKTAKFDEVSGTESGDGMINIQNPADKFIDVDQTDWFYDNVQYVVENGLFNGTSSNEFAPNVNLTRGMLVTVLYRLAGATDTEKSTFDDVDENSYYSAPIAWAEKNGYVNGVGNNKFNPDENITREDLATIIYRYIKAQGKGFTGSWMFLLSYEDRDEISDYAYEPICWLTMNGVLAGKGNNRIAPKELATRAETAKIIHMVTELLK